MNEHLNSLMIYSTDSVQGFLFADLAVSDGDVNWKKRIASEASLEMKTSWCLSVTTAGPTMT